MKQFDADVVIMIGITDKDDLQSLNVISTLGREMPTLTHKPTVSTKLSEMVSLRGILGITHKPRNYNFVYDLYRDSDDDGLIHGGYIELGILRER